jgi:hypothetical protein
MAVFDGTEGDAITLATGADLTARFRGNYSTQPKARFFGKDILGQILAQTGCKGIRMYYGQNSTGVFELVLVGADASGNDMLNLIADISTPCPSVCSSNNDLNS